MNAITRHSLLVAGIAASLAVAACKSDGTKDTTGPEPASAPAESVPPPASSTTMPMPTNPTDSTPPPVSTPPAPTNPPSNP